MNMIRYLALILAFFPAVAWGASTSTPPSTGNLNLSALSVASNGQIISLPPNSTVLYAFGRETTGNNVTVNLGTTAGSSDVAQSILLGGNSNTMIPINAFRSAWWSATVSQAIFISSSNWNSSSVNFTIFYAVGR